MINNQNRVERNTIIAVIVMIAITVIGIIVYRNFTAPENTADKGQDNTAGTLVDGTYTSEADEPHNGFKGLVTMEVKDSKITSLVYDGIGEDGTKKSVLAAGGEYVMTESNPRWDEQAVALAEYVIENQATSGLTMDDEGKTDAVSGVSIDISEFVNLTEDCLKQAADE